MQDVTVRIPLMHSRSLSQATEGKNQFCEDFRLGCRARFHRRLQFQFVDNFITYADKKSAVRQDRVPEELKETRDQSGVISRGDQMSSNYD